MKTLHHTFNNKAQIESLYVPEYPIYPDLHPTWASLQAQFDVIQERTFNLTIKENPTQPSFDEIAVSVDRQLARIQPLLSAHHEKPDPDDSHNYIFSTLITDANGFRVRFHFTYGAENHPS